MVVPRFKSGSGALIQPIRDDRFFLLLPMYYVYLLYSSKCDRYYIGYCADIEARLRRHNSGMVTATRNCCPYILRGFKLFETESEARKEEARIKKQKSRKYIEWLLEGNW